MFPRCGANMVMILSWERSLLDGRLGSLEMAEWDFNEAQIV